MADEGFLNQVIEQYRDESVQQFPLDVTGQIAHFFQPEPLAPGDVVGPRRGMVYRTHVSEDSVRINFGTRSITFPGFLRETLDFALGTQAYPIEDLAGDLEVDEKIVVIERLMEEGLVIRIPPG
jgi:hypothetical protein